jgi:hypothetical protein
MTEEKITFAHLVERLGAQNTPRDCDSLYFLRLFLDAYRRDLANDGPRVSELSSLIGEIESDIHHVDPRLEMLDNLCESLPEPSLDCEVVNLRTAAYELLCMHRAFLAKLNAVKEAVGKDAGGHGTAASKLSGGSAKRRFARNLATVFDDFKGPPSGTREGDFHKFVCEAHEVATGEEARGFETDVQDAAKYYRALSPRK